MPNGICAAEDIRRAVVQCKQRLQRIGRQNVVCVHKGQPFAPRRRHADIPRPRYAAVGLMNCPNPRIILRQPIQRRARSICRTVVYGNQFPI